MAMPSRGDARSGPVAVNNKGPAPKPPPQGSTTNNHNNSVGNISRQQPPQTNDDNKAMIAARQQFMGEQAKLQSQRDSIERHQNKLQAEAEELFPTMKGSNVAAVVAGTPKTEQHQQQQQLQQQQQQQQNNKEREPDEQHLSQQNQNQQQKPSNILENHFPKMENVQNAMAPLRETPSQLHQQQQHQQMNTQPRHRPPDQQHPMHQHLQHQRATAAMSSLPRISGGGGIGAPQPPAPAPTSSSNSGGNPNTKGLASLARSASPYTAGDLLGKSHEELVLLLIQLRRDAGGLARGIQQIRAEIEAQMSLVDGPRGEVALRHCQELSFRLRDMERQFELQKPVLHLVSNMVKLGSLYGPQDPNLQQQQHQQQQQFLSRKEVQQKRLDTDQQQRRTAAAGPTAQSNQMFAYQGDQGPWDPNTHSPDHKELQMLLEGALESVRQKLQDVGALGPGELEKLRSHQQQLERELAQVRAHMIASALVLRLGQEEIRGFLLGSALANFGKIEEVMTTSWPVQLEDAEQENLRLEHELIALRQKVLMALKHATSLQAHGYANRELEAELVKVQKLTKDVQRRRVDLSYQVKSITERSLSSNHLNLIANEMSRGSPTGYSEDDEDIPMEPFPKEHAEIVIPGYLKEQAEVFQDFGPNEWESLMDLASVVKTKSISLIAKRGLDSEVDETEKELAREKVKLEKLKAAVKELEDERSNLEERKKIAALQREMAVLAAKEADLSALEFLGCIKRKAAGDLSSVLLRLQGLKDLWFEEGAGCKVYSEENVWILQLGESSEKITIRVGKLEHLMTRFVKENKVPGVRQPSSSTPQTKVSSVISPGPLRSILKTIENSAGASTSGVKRASTSSLMSGVGATVKRRKLRENPKFLVGGLTDANLEKFMEGKQFIPEKPVEYRRNVAQRLGLTSEHLERLEPIQLPVPGCIVQDWQHNTPEFSKIIEERTSDPLKPQVLVIGTSLTSYIRLGDVVYGGEAIYP
ncbi:unnamed protein product [Notodromas monacha]|uniref:Pleckstrin homology domain-containing protein n=1 Tax=Notodromas monacha TaxID=399045 RepID=A0A7R9BJ55_9CRUS|nr:unnamed protein product [Notodromas monacha]CAG0915095.1 unnamed protein product [Notodromas monacha]